MCAAGTGIALGLLVLLWVSSEQTKPNEMAIRFFFFKFAGGPEHTECFVLFFFCVSTCPHVCPHSELAYSSSLCGRLSPPPRPLPPHALSLAFSLALTLWASPHAASLQIPQHFRPSFCSLVPPATCMRTWIAPRSEREGVREGGGGRE